MVSLQHPLIRVIRGDQIAYGGSQMWAENSTFQEVGCGIIAAQDLILHLAHHHPELPNGIAEEASLESAAEYNRFGQFLRKTYFPLIPKFGITGLQLAYGLNRYFRRHGIPLQASWGATQKHIFEDIAQMLEKDIPVILSVGQNFPRTLKKQSLTAYTKDREGRCHAACGIRAHYMIVTAMDAEYLTVSSWGEQYYLSRQEFSDYAKRSSFPLFCNIIRIKPCIRRKSRL